MARQSHWVYYFPTIYYVQCWHWEYSFFVCNLCNCNWHSLIGWDLRISLEHACSGLRYVGVIWFVFLVLYLLLIRFTSELCVISNSIMKHQQKPDCKSNLPWFSHGNQKCMFVDSLIEYIAPPNRVHYCLEILFFNICLYGVCSLIHTNQI